MKLFDSFAETMEQLPPQAIFEAVAREQKMIEDDIFHERPFPVEDSLSILKFCRFIEAKLTGKEIPLGFLPHTHVAFYRKIVTRLVEAGELPPYAAQQFDAKFPVNFSEAAWAGL